MTTDQFGAAFNAAASGKPGDTAVVFKCLSEKAAGGDASTVNAVYFVGEQDRVYPSADVVPAHVLIELA